MHLRSSSCFSKISSSSILRKTVNFNFFPIWSNFAPDDGYKLNFMGYDYLALHVFLKRGHIEEVIMKVGVGKESGKNSHFRLKQA
jgi:RIO kinase 2